MHNFRKQPSSEGNLNTVQASSTNNQNWRMYRVQ